jgi:putative heme-binding domain-containing protein
LTDIPTPDPVAERAAMQVAEGYEVNLFASDPDFSKPIHMNWDAQGRLWIASSQNYPQLKPGAEPTDQIIILEDTDGDGVSDKRTVFADDLMIPTGVLPGDGGVYVANSVQLIHLSDTDGDGRADLKRTILSGFGTEDTHHLLHTLRMRPDGRMAMNQSIYIHSHLETPYGIKHLDGGGVWHFDPDNFELEVFIRGLVNPWGHAINEFGQSLATDGAGGEGINYLFPGGVYFTAPGATRWLKGLNPGSPKHCGLEFISGSAMPADMRDVLITNDFRGHRVCRFRLERQGSGYRSVQLPDLIRSDHIAFRPIDVKMGPDGAIYVADWYNPIIQHGEVDFRDPRRDTEHGRIWRITAKGLPATKRPDYAAASEDELVQLLTDSALWVQQFAREELEKRDAGQVAAAVAKLDVSQDAYLALQPLWIQLARRQVDVATVDELRQHADPRVRAAAFRVIGERHAQLPDAAAWLTQAIDDSDDQVVLEAVCGLHRLGTLDAVRQVLRAAGRPGKDQHLNFAIWNALRENESTWMPAFESGELVIDDLAALDALADATTTNVVARSLAKQVASQPAAQQPRTVELIASRGDAESLATLIQWIAASDKLPNEKASLLEPVLVQSRARNLLPANAASWLPGIMQDLRGVREGVPGIEVNYSNLVIAYARAAEQWKVAEASRALNIWLDSSVAGKMPVPAAAVLNALAVTGGEAGQTRVRTMATDLAVALPLRVAAIAALSGFDPALAANTIIDIYRYEFSDDPDAELPPEVSAAIVSILSRQPGVEAITQAIAGTQAASWPPKRAREFLAAVRSSTQSSEPLVASIVVATGLENAGWKMSTELTARLVQLVNESGDAARGEQIYRREKLLCITCHAIGPSGIDIGPNLVSLGGSAPLDYIIESLIDPAAKAKEGFQTLSVLLDTDEVLSGLQKSRTDEALQLLLADGTLRTISSDSIEAVREGKSLMPAGLVDQLSERELADLIAFLSKLGRAPEYTVDTKNWVRNWQMLTWTPAAHSRLNRTSFDTVATDDPALVWRLWTSQVDGTAPLPSQAAFRPHASAPPTVFLRCDIECREAGEIQLKFTQPIEALSFWIDGEAQPVPAADESLQLSVGTHRIVIGTRIEQTSGSLGCEVISAGAQVIVP